MSHNKMNKCALAVKLGLVVGAAAFAMPALALQTAAASGGSFMTSPSKGMTIDAGSSPLFADMRNWKTALPCCSSRSHLYWT